SSATPSASPARTASGGGKFRPASPRLSATTSGRWRSSRSEGRGMRVPTRHVLYAGATVIAASCGACGGDRVTLQHDHERSAKLLESLKAHSTNWAAASADYNP